MVRHAKSHSRTYVANCYSVVTLLCHAQECLRLPPPTTDVNAGRYSHSIYATDFLSRKEMFRHSLIVFPVSTMMSLGTNPPYKGLERAFCVRMKSTLTKRGCHFKSSGYRVSFGTLRAGILINLRSISGSSDGLSTEAAVYVLALEEVAASLTGYGGPRHCASTTQRPRNTLRI